MSSIVNLDKVQAVKAGNIVSIKHSADVDNGRICNLGALESDERELYALATPATATLGSAEVILIASPEVVYESGKGLADFTNKAGKAMRGYHLTVGDVFTVTDDAIDGATVVGQYVIPANASLKLAAAADLTGNTRFAAQVIEKGTLGYAGAAATTVRVVKA